MTCNATHHTNRKPTGTQRLSAAEGSRSGHCENRPSFHQWQAATYYLRQPLLSLLFSLLPSTWGALGPEKKKGVKGKIKPPQILGSSYKSGGLCREEKKWYWNQTWCWHCEPRTGLDWAGVAATDRKAVGSAWRYHQQLSPRDRPGKLQGGEGATWSSFIPLMNWRFSVDCWQ